MDMSLIVVVLLQAHSVFSCLSVTNNCYGNTDPDYIPIAVHRSVERGNHSVEIQHFCRDLPELNSCVNRFLLMCPVGTAIWRKWSATKLLNQSFCEVTNSKVLAGYTECIDRPAVRVSLDQCSQLLSWNISQYNRVLDDSGLEQRCSDYEWYSDCMVQVVSEHCGGTIADWFTSLYTGRSYLLTECKDKYGSVLGENCRARNPHVKEAEVVCEQQYHAGLTAIISATVVIGSGYEYKKQMCLVTRTYAKCELDEIAVHCGLQAAEDYRQKIHDDSAQNLASLQCRLDDVPIDTPASTIAVTTSSKSSTKISGDGGDGGITPTTSTVRPTVYDDSTSQPVEGDGSYRIANNTEIILAVCLPALVIITIVITVVLVKRKRQTRLDIIRIGHDIFTINKAYMSGGSVGSCEKVSPSLISDQYASISGSIATNITQITVNPNPDGDPGEIESDYDSSEFDSVSCVTDVKPPSSVESATGRTKDWVQLDTFKISNTHIHQ